METQENSIDSIDSATRVNQLTVNSLNGLSFDVAGRNIDTIKNTLTISNGDNSGLRLTNLAGHIWQLRTYTDGRLGVEHYNPATKKWTMHLRYIEANNKWSFENIDDVLINNKAALKMGDAVAIYGNLLDKNLNKLTGLNSGTYYQNSNKLATTQNGYPAADAGDLQIIQNGVDGVDGCSQIYTTYKNTRQFIRNYRAVSKTWEPWIEQITTKNSTVDSNGFYKKASPILRLYGTENIENVDGFKKSGCGLVNDLAVGVTAKRIGVGHYEIRGSLGFAKEGWYIQLPEDANGNKKFFAEYSADKNGIITVKTFTKQFNAKLCEIVAGEPVDITNDRWIDVRLEMPVVEDVEPIETTEKTEIIEEKEPAINEQKTPLIE